jgi:hypothetical protein
MQQGSSRVAAACSRAAAAWLVGCEHIADVLLGAATLTHAAPLRRWADLSAGTNIQCPNNCYDRGRCSDTSNLSLDSGGLAQSSSSATTMADAWQGFRCTCEAGE